MDWLRLAMVSDQVDPAVARVENGAQPPVYERDDERGEEGLPESGYRPKRLHQAIDEPEEQRVHNEDEKPERDDDERQAEQHQHRPNEGIHETQQQRHEEKPTRTGV